MGRRAAGTATTSTIRRAILPEDPNTLGEGGDCSGFTFKSWWERAETGDPWFRYHAWMQNVHGPYTAADFKAGAGASNTTVAKANTTYMDAFAASNHIGMIYWANTAFNQDRIIEAKCEACGTGNLAEDVSREPRLQRSQAALLGRLTVDGMTRLHSQSGRAALHDGDPEAADPVPRGGLLLGDQVRAETARGSPGHRPA